MMQTDRYEEYPKLKELVNRKDDLVAVRATPPYYLKVRPAAIGANVSSFRTCQQVDNQAAHCCWQLGSKN